MSDFQYNPKQQEVVDRLLERGWSPNPVATLRVVRNSASAPEKVPDPFAFSQGEWHLFLHHYGGRRGAFREATLLRAEQQPPRPWNGGVPSTSELWRFAGPDPCPLDSVLPRDRYARVLTVAEDPALVVWLCAEAAARVQARDTALAEVEALPLPLTRADLISPFHELTRAVSAAAHALTHANGSTDLVALSEALQRAGESLSLMSDADACDERRRALTEIMERDADESALSDARRDDDGYRISRADFKRGTGDVPIGT